GALQKLMTLQTLSRLGSLLSQYSLHHNFSMVTETLQCKRSPQIGFGTAVQMQGNVRRRWQALYRYGSAAPIRTRDSTFPARSLVRISLRLAFVIYGTRLVSSRARLRCATG